jgi:hypothetical protein
VKLAGTIRFAALAAIALVWVSLAMIRVRVSRADDWSGATPLDGSSCPLNGTDPDLNTGIAATNDYSPTGSTTGTTITPHGAANQLWLYSPNPYGITQGSGSIDMSYTGSSSFGWTTNLSGLNTAGVVAYPNISYGRSLFSGNGPEGQPPQFPAEISNLMSMPIDVAYTITDNEMESHNIDVLFDEWVTTDANTLYTDIGDWLEVGVFPYLAFPGGYAGALVKTFQEPVTLNGASTTISFYEYSASSGTCVNDQCGQAVFFYAVPDQNVASGEIAFDMLDFIKEAVTASGIAGLNYVQAHQLGTEFGGSSDQNFSFTMSKFGFGLVPQVCPTPTPTPTASPGSLSFEPTSLSFPVTGVGAKPAGKFFTIRNLSKTTTLRGTITVPSGPFSATPNGAFQLMPHVSQRVTVDFTPTDAMAHMEDLVINSNDPSHSSVNVSLSGTGEAGELSAPASIKFPATKVGATASRTEVLRNRGKGTLTGSIAALSAPYSITPSGPITIDAGKPLSIKISYMPTGTAPADTDVSITVEAPSTPASVMIPVSGSGK